MENHYLLWENSLFQWLCSIAMITPIAPDCSLVSEACISPPNKAFVHRRWDNDGTMLGYEGVQTLMWWCCPTKKLVIDFLNAVFKTNAGKHLEWFVVCNGCSVSICCCSWPSEAVVVVSPTGFFQNQQPVSMQYAAYALKGWVRRILMIAGWWFGTFFHILETIIAID